MSPSTVAPSLRAGARLLQPLGGLLLLISVVFKSGHKLDIILHLNNLKLIAIQAIVAHDIDCLLFRAIEHSRVISSLLNSVSRTNLELLFIGEYLDGRRRMA